MIILVPLEVGRS